MPATAADDGSPAPRTSLERWLGSWVRRQVLVWSGVVLLALLSASIMAETFASMGRDVEFGALFGRRFVDWALWGILFEPIAQLSLLLARLVRPRLLLVPIHLCLAFGTALGVGAVDPIATEALLGPPAFPRRWSAEEGREPDRSRARAWSRLRGGALDRGVLAYLGILGLGWSVQVFLRGRAQARRTAELALEAARLEARLASAELTNLRHQLHPHFLFNSLHSVGGLIREGRDRVALETLSNLGELLRAALERGGSQEWTLGEELELVEAYLDIERLRLGERLRVTTSIEPGLARVRVPSLVLLPLVENAITHAIAPRPEGGSLALDVRREEGAVRIELEDDGSGFPAAVLAGGQAGSASGRSSIGVENTRRRLASLYGESGGLELENRTEGGARVVLRVPAREGSA